MGRKSYDWRLGNQEAMLSWAACEAVCAIVGVNAAIVFHPLWFWAHRGRATPDSGRKERVWKAHSAASLSRDLGFMSDDVVLDALHRLEDAGLILRRRGRWALLWAIADAGYTLMGEAVPCQSEAVEREVASGVATSALVRQSPLAPVRRVMRINLVNHRRAHLYPTWQGAGHPKGMPKGLTKGPHEGLITRRANGRPKGVP